MALLYHVHGGGSALCPLFNANPIIETALTENIQCNTSCVWIISHYNDKGDTDYFTCCMNDREVAAMKIKEKLNAD